MTGEVQAGEATRSRVPQALSHTAPNSPHPPPALLPRPVGGRPRIPEAGRMPAHTPPSSPHPIHRTVGISPGGGDREGTSRQVKSFALHSAPRSRFCNETGWGRKLGMPAHTAFHLSTIHTVLLSPPHPRLWHSSPASAGRMYNPERPALGGGPGTASATAPPL